MKESLEDDSSGSRSPSSIKVHVMLGNRNETHTDSGTKDSVTVDAKHKIVPIMTPRDCTSKGDEDAQEKICVLDCANESNDQQHDWKSSPTRQPLHLKDQLQIHVMNPKIMYPSISTKVKCDILQTDDSDELTMSVSAREKRSIDTVIVSHQDNTSPQSPTKKKKTISLAGVRSADNESDISHHPLTEEDVNNNSSSAGRWTPIEHQAFLLGMAVHGREWKKVAEKIPSRTSAQVRSHAQKYFAKVERQQQLNSSQNTSTLPDVHSSSLYADDYYQYDVDLTLSTKVSSHGGAMCTPYAAIGTGDSEKRRETSSSQQSKMTQQNSNTRVLLSPPIQHLSETAQQEAARIISSPATVEAEVQDTLQRLHERYRHLQEQLQRRQQLRQNQQQQQQELPVVHEAHVEEAPEPQQAEEPVIVENERHQQLDDVASQNDNRVELSVHHFNTKGTSQRKEVENFQRAGTSGEDKRRNRSNSSVCCSLSTSTNNDSASSLLLLAESIVQVQSQDEIIALNVLRNGLYQHMMSLQTQQQHEESTENAATVAANKLQITIELDETNDDEFAINDNILAGYSNDETWNNTNNENSSPSIPVLETVDKCDENSHSSQTNNEDVSK
jgi:SHAQKYF class myb-like DNA-binding protein